MNNQQHGRGLGLNMSRADCVPALFARLVHLVGTYKAAFVVEDQRRQLE
jgi:hypothetical protein